MIFGLLCTFLSDAGAYYTGKNLGKIRLSPRLSPKKTWEGLLGGIAVSIVSGIVFTLIYAQIVPLQGTYPLWLIVVLGFAIAVLDLMGDLTASMFKREFDVKDMGSLIPGHGGMLDRMDGVIPVGAALYIIIQVLR
jgi:phosphatidate cytidylyltransferase